MAERARIHPTDMNPTRAVSTSPPPPRRPNGPSSVGSRSPATEYTQRHGPAREVPAPPRRVASERALLGRVAFPCDRTHPTPWPGTRSTRAALGARRPNGPSSVGSRSPATEKKKEASDRSTRSTWRQGARKTGRGEIGRAGARPSQSRVQPVRTPRAEGGAGTLRTGPWCWERLVT